MTFEIAAGAPERACTFSPVQIEVESGGTVPASPARVGVADGVADGAAVGPAVDVAVGAADVDGPTAGAIAKRLASASTAKATSTAAAAAGIRHRTGRAGRALRR